MRHQTKLRTVLSAGLLTAATTGMVFAQAPQTRERDGARGGDANAAQPNANANANAEGNNPANEGQGSQRIISHALYAVINGSDLHFAAQAARGGAHHRDAANQQKADDANKENAARQANEKNANDGDRRGRDEASQQREQQEREQVAQQLQRQADGSFQAGDRMLRFAEKGLGADNGAEGRDAWSRRLYTAADQYANSLRSFAGVNAEQATRSPNAADRDNENRGQARTNRVDAARVVLINQAVKESLVAAEMRQAVRAHGANRPWAQHLQERAQQVANESDRLLQQVIDDASKGEGRQDQANPANAAENKDNNNNQANDNAANQGQAGRGNPEGRPSVQALAQQARQVVQTLERIGAGETRQNPAEGARENR